jgi:outer membrane lipoprotein-sorting protein
MPKHLLFLLLVVLTLSGCAFVGNSPEEIKHRQDMGYGDFP